MKKLVLTMIGNDEQSHYGDLFTCKAYVKQLKEELENQIDIRYCHLCHPRALLDLNINTIGVDALPDQINIKLPYLEDGNTLYVNIWKAQQEVFDGKIGVNHEFLQLAWKNIFLKINEFFRSNLILKNIEYYIPSINYDVFLKNKKLNQYLNSTTELKKILISNGPVTSGQSFSDNMEEPISRLANEYPNIEFICTTTFDTSLPNIIFTNNIIDQIDDIHYKTRTCDLNEISYLSKFCDIIVGKNSGPFIFCLTKENIFDKDKSIISMHKKPTDDMMLYTNHTCDYEFHKLNKKTYDPAIAFSIIDKKIKEKLI
jgi:hypothetical protein